MNPNCKCAIWGTPAIGGGSTGLDGKTYDGLFIDSPRAGGLYFVPGSVKMELTYDIFSKEQRALLTTWLVDQRQSGNPCPEITSDIVKSVGSQRDSKIGDRIDRILKYLKTKAPRISDHVIYRVF